MMKNLITYNKPNDYPHVFAPKFNPEIWNKNLTTVHKDHNIGLQKNQMHPVKQLMYYRGMWQSNE